MIMHNGALLDINKLLEQMKRLEKTGAETEKLLVSLRKENAELEHSNAKATNKIKDLNADIKGLNRKLADTEKDYRDVNVSFSIYLWSFYGTIKYVSRAQIMIYSALI